ncbi:nitroreductase/quinone reductase family protein [Mycolicibacterium sp. XJ870]
MANDPFPEPRWGREGISPVFKPVYAFASTPFGSWFIRRLVPLDRKVMNRTNGRYTLFGPTSLPQLLLTSTGRKSGQPRKTPLSYLRDGDRILVLGSNFGGKSHPSWSSNLVAYPEAAVSIAGEEIPVTATQLRDSEREQALVKFFEYPMYAAYRRRTDRDLRVFALTRR